MPQHRSFANGIELLIAPKTLLTLLTGSISLSVLGNAVYQVLTNWLTTSNMAMVRIIGGAVLMLLGVTWVVGRLAQRLQPALPLPNKQTPQPRRGLILLVSNEPTALRAIAWHQRTLHYCWLVCSAQSMPVATKLQAILQDQEKQATLVLINDVFDLLECRQKVDAIYTQLPAATPAGRHSGFYRYDGHSFCGGSACLFRYTTLAAIHPRSV